MIFFFGLFIDFWNFFFQYFIICFLDNRVVCCFCAVQDFHTVDDYFRYKWVVSYLLFELVKRLRKRNSPGVNFQRFSDSRKMKILSSTCHFKLVKVNELTWSQYTFTPFSGWDLLFTKNEYLDRTWSRGSLRYCFLPFRIRETIYEKGQDEVSFLFFFCKLLKHEKCPSFPFVGLVKF